MVFHKPTTSLFFSLLIFQQLRSILPSKFFSILSILPEALCCSSRRCYQLYYLFCSGRISPQVLRCLHKPTRIISFRCWFSNNSIITFFEGCFPSSFVAEIGISFYILLFQWSIFYSFFRRHGDVALFTHHLELWGSCSFRAYPFNRSVVSSLQVLFILSSYPCSFSRSAAQICSSLFLVYLGSTRVV